MEPNLSQNTPPTVTPPPVTAKSAPSSLIPIIICAVLALGGIGFGIYGMISSSHKSSEISSLQEQLTQQEPAPTKPEIETTTPETPKEEITTPETPDPYAVFASNLAKNYHGTVLGQYYHWTGSDNVEYTMSADVDENNHLQIIDLNNNQQIIAEADNIISVYFVKLGNGGVPYFYMISKNGQVSRLDISDTSSHTIENLNDYTNIVAVMQGGDLRAWLIDIDGNIYKSA